MADTGILAVVSPDLAAQRGIAQNKIPGEDLLDHTLRTVDAATAGSPRVRLAALVHDIGKPATIDDGPFRRHDTVGADLAAALLDRLHLPRATTDRVVHLVRNHMFTYDPAWGDSGGPTLYPARRTGRARRALRAAGRGQCRQRRSGQMRTVSTSCATASGPSSRPRFRSISGSSRSTATIS